MYMAKFIDYHMNLFLISLDPESHKYSKQSPNKLLITTLGTDNKLAFSNSLHVDFGDAYSKRKESVHVEVFPKYVHTMDKMIKLGSATTCCYQHIKKEIQVDLIQFYAMEGLGCAVGIDDCTTHHFYSHAFVHNT